MLYNIFDWRWKCGCHLQCQSSIEIYSYITAMLRGSLLPDYSYLWVSIVFTRFHQKKSCNSHHFILDFSFFLKKSRNFCIIKSFLGNSPESKITAKLTLVDIIVLYTIILKTCLKVIKPTILKIASKKR